MTLETKEQHQQDSERIFTAITSGKFETFVEAQEAISKLYMPDKSFSRGGICLALNRLSNYYKAKLMQEIAKDNQ